MLAADPSLAVEDLGYRRGCHAHLPGGFGMGHAPFLEEVPEHVRPGEVRDRMMDPLVRLDQVREDVEIVLFPPREIAADRQRVDDLGGTVEVPLGTEWPEGEFGDQLHVAG